MSTQGWVECSNCEDGLEYPTPSFTESHPLPVPCPDCADGLVPSEAVVEAAAIAIYEAGDRYGNARSLTTWEAAGDEYRGWIRHQARAAVVAARRAERTEG